MIDVVTIGETMAAMAPKEVGSLKYLNNFSKYIAGAESNVAIGIKRLGFKSGWISKLGKDPLGDYVEFFIRGEGVDVSQVKKDSDHRTGLLIKEMHTTKEPKVFYYRDNSAASHLEPDDIDEGYIKKARHMHLTGITPALSDSAQNAFFRALNYAKKNGLRVSFDPNLRFKLWSTVEEMKNVMLNIIPQVDVLLPGIEEGEILLGLSEPEAIIKAFYEMMNEGSLVVLKLGAKGALYYQGDQIVHVDPYKVSNIVDLIGAGDAFAAGLITGLLREMSIKEAVELANLVGALCITVKGDIEGLPTWEQVEVYQGKKEEIHR
ncbi:sugar kinase [Halanaerobium hydrogeniformans]|uniref:PfkB domain protein n=1 Tax=Halanaerobium hydrogeniformans TaxID=656519 RepID=E4RNJ1_HALHG|nr:sugar kinase [Halanaerobium hydrogeniformans]ADQ13526.1 PfkB domain protein [Halanaerobium hydrogeniformans]